MPSENIFTTYAAQKQAEIIIKLMDLFKSNERGYGVGEIRGTTFLEDKNKWKPGNVRTVKSKANESEWRTHLLGERFLGQSPLLDDGTIWYASLDVDIYEIDYRKEMEKIKKSGFPLVVFRTKSGGLRPTIFFSEAIPADTVVDRMASMASTLGYAGCEVFPKQTKLDVSNGDLPSWIFVPFGPALPEMFPEQCCMDDNGNAMDLYDSVIYAIRMRISRQQFENISIQERKAKANGRANGKKRPGGIWEEEETVDKTITTMFCDGPPCLWDIAHSRSRNFQHNLLFDMAVFVMRKYPENWEQALEWINMNILTPVGASDKLEALRKDFKNKKGDPYQYRCKDEPICSHCNPYACRKMMYGVGTTNNDGINHYELGITILNKTPRQYIINGGTHRIILETRDLFNVQMYKEMIRSHGVLSVPKMNKIEWEENVTRQLEEATIVEPSELLQTNADEILLMGRYFRIHIPNMVRAKGEEYLNGKFGDFVRIRIKEERIYFKWDSLSSSCMRSGCSDKQIQGLKMFVENKAEFHKRDEGRGWFRSSYSVPFKMFSEEYLEKWLSPDLEEEGKTDE